MKFACDRCKTRYSIGDERVRGKILKIRCKNCANVIAVREGMSEDGEDSGVASAPPPPAGASPLGSALAGAFAGAMKSGPVAAPAALDEEWFVAVDGHQEGPYSLTEAQAWVAGKRPNQELFCWSEGFDDWLSVEKVSHFRGLRLAKPPPRPGTSRPPPRIAAMDEPTIAEEEPRPLFAATMAALEAKAAASEIAKKDKSGPLSTAGASLSGPTAAASAPATGASASSSSRLPATSGASASSSSRLPATSGASASSSRLPAASTSQAMAAAPAMSSGRVGGAVTPTPSAPVNGSAGAKANGPASTAKAIGPAGSAKANGPAGAAAPKPGRFDLGDSAHADVTLETAAPDDLELEDDNGPEDSLEIGEVSRVVRLADIGSRSGASPASSLQRTTQAVPAIARGTGMAPALAAAAAVSQAGAVAPGETSPPPTLSPRSHNLLLLVAGVVAVAVIIVVTVVAMSSSREGGVVATGDTSRFESLGFSTDDPRRRAGEPAVPEPGDKNPGSRTSGRRVATAPTPINGGGTGTNPSNGKTEVIIGPDGQPLLPLSGDDVVAVSQRYQTGTRRCYERATKEDPFLKVTKILVDLKIDAAGTVSSVKLDTYMDTKLGQCLAGAIKRWSFRRSTEGLVVQFPLIFEQR